MSPKLPHRPRADRASRHTRGMSFLRRLLGSRNRSSTPPERAATAPARAARPPRPQGADPAPRTPTLADLSPRPLHAYFEYVGGGSSKFYAVSLEEEDADLWRVRFTFGRIGSSRAWASRIEDASWAKAARAYSALVDEKVGKGYELRAWPPHLTLPDGAAVEADAGTDGERTLFRAPSRGVLPPETGGTLGGVPLPDGRLHGPQPEGGSRGQGPVIWASERAVPNVGRTWSALVAAFPETGVWPVVIEASRGLDGFHDYLMDTPRGRHAEVLTILRRGWADNTDPDDDDAGGDLAPFGRTFPGLAAPTPGERATSIDHVVASSQGHLGLVAVHRPADILDAIGWMGAANIDGDPLDMTTVLRSWEVRFDAYVIGLGTHTLSLAVGRPPRNLVAATAIAAEHYAFCPDNITQGVGTISEYAESLLDAEVWPFWWD